MDQTSERLFKQQRVVIERLCSSYAKGRIGHAYVFEGERGTGKMETAQFFTKLLLCESPEDSVPCGTCHSCRRITSGNHPNLTVIHPDGQDIKKDQMSDLIFQMTKKGYESGRKIYIISAADRMNVAAANTLLKFLEEPEGDVTALLLTDSYQSILPTIQSRCQRVSFIPPSREALMTKLKEKGVTASMAATVTMVTASEEEAFLLAGDEQFAQRRKTVLKLIEASDRHIHEALLFIQTDWAPLFKEKEETAMGLDLLLYAYRDVVATKAGLQSTPTFPDQQELIRNLAMKMTYSQLSATMETIMQAKKKLHGNMNRMLLMEQLMLSVQEGLLVV